MDAVWDDSDIYNFEYKIRNNSDNGEQKMDGYMVLHAKISKEFSSGIAINLGVDNILDKTYSTTSTTAADSAVDNVMLLNELGRYLYLNASYKF